MLIRGGFVIVNLPEFGLTLVGCNSALVWFKVHALALELKVRLLPRSSIVESVGESLRVGVGAESDELNADAFGQKADVRSFLLCPNL